MSASPVSASPSDPRHITVGWEIPREEYCDQPYVVVTDEEAWLCVMTTARGHEGARSQHIVATRSTDRGRTWSPLVDVEPPGPPESSYATVLKAPNGRVFAFYNHNTDNCRDVKRSDGSSETRVDTQGHFVWKFSDDGGLTWSPERQEILVRESRVDRENAHGGAIRFFWHVGRPLALNGAAYVTLHKVGSFERRGFMNHSEGWFLRSPNLLTEPDPAKVTWETLPEGDVGLRAPGSTIAEEQSIVALSDQRSLFCTYRTIAGSPAAAYSRDEGRTWTLPAFMTYADGRPVKHPRAANFVWKCANGCYLYWFHNHGGKWYEDRNPAWLLGGVEADGPSGEKVILWSEPEILLYDDDPNVRMSYPDLIEQEGIFYATETQKTVARVHEIDATLLNGLWGQFGPGAVTRDGLLLEQAADVPAGAAPRLTDLRQVESGFSVEVWLAFEGRMAAQTIADTRGPDGPGWSLETTHRETVRLTLSDGRTENTWECDPNSLRPEGWQHIVVTVDGGPKIITFVVNGRFCDGERHRQFGWGRFSPHLRDVSGGELLVVPPRRRAQLGVLRMYGRPLRTSEAVGNFHAGFPTGG